MAHTRSCIQLDIPGVSAENELDIELNTRREIPYLRAAKILFSENIYPHFLRIKLLSIAAHKR